MLEQKSTPRTAKNLHHYSRSSYQGSKCIFVISFKNIRTMQGLKRRRSFPKTLTRFKSLFTSPRRMDEVRFSASQRLRMEIKWNLKRCRHDIFSRKFWLMSHDMVLHIKHLIEETFCFRSAVMYRLVLANAIIFYKMTAFGRILLVLLWKYVYVNTDVLY